MSTMTTPTKRMVLMVMMVVFVLMMVTIYDDDDDYTSSNAIMIHNRCSYQDKLLVASVFVVVEQLNFDLFKAFDSSRHRPFEHLQSRRNWLVTWDGGRRLQWAWLLFRIMCVGNYIGLIPSPKPT